MAKVATVMCGARLPQVLVGRIDEACASRGVSRAYALAEGARLWLDAGTVEHRPHKPEVAGSIPAPATKLDALLRTIPGLKTAETMDCESVVPLGDVAATVPDRRLCLKTWWNNDPERGDGEQYECGREDGHKGACDKGRVM
jgi:hypothetical protein